MKSKVFIISLLSIFCMTTQAQQIEIFEPAMMEVEYHPAGKITVFNRFDLCHWTYTEERHYV